MNKTHTFSATASLFLLFFSIGVQSSMRCGSEIINEGDAIFEVLHKYRKPKSSGIISPVTSNNSNKTRNKVAPVERRAYGPDNGMYRHLRIVDGTLIQIKTRLIKASLLNAYPGTKIPEPFTKTESRPKLNRHIRSR